MIREKTQKELVIDLTGPDGNAFALMAYAKRLATQLGMNYHVIIDEMKQGDYEHLVKTFDFHFGDYVILER
jgi:hypothetical protein|tara:strand:- start:5966 stop:6178 length:213 start_codon:yes stop_codon:yes gene_type:complete